MKFLKVLNAFFPWLYWLPLVVGLFMLANGRNGNVLISLSLLMFSIPFCVIFHEAGHLFFARLAGGRPRRMILGAGSEVIRMMVGDLRIIINKRVNSGQAIATFDSFKNPALRYFIFVLGGPLTNSLLFLITIYFFDFNFDVLGGRDYVDVASIFAFTNMIIAIINFFPFYTRRDGMRRPSDGMLLFQILFKDKYSQAIEGAARLMDAADLFDAGKFNEAIIEYQRFLELNPDHDGAARLNIAVAHLRLGHVETALLQLTELEVRAESDFIKSYGAFLYNAMAWVYMTTDKLDLADKYSQKTLDIEPQYSDGKNTRGCVLICLGRLDEGISLAKENFDFDSVNPRTLSTGPYLMLAYHLKGDRDTSAKYRDFLQKNITRMSADEKQTFDRLLAKINP